MGPICTVDTDLEAAETKADTLVLLGNVSKHFGCESVEKRVEWVKDGTAEGFSKSLHDQFVLRPTKGNKRRTMESTRALQVAVLCKALNKILRCPKDELQTHGSAYVREYLVPSLPRVLETMVNWKGDATIRVLTLINTLRVMKRIEPISHPPVSRFIQSCCLLLGDRLPSEVTVDASLAIAQFVNYKPSSTYESIQAISPETQNRLISILSTSATTVSNSRVRESVFAIGMLAKSPIFCSKMSKRRCCALAIQRNMKHNDMEVRHCAVLLAKRLLLGHGVVSNSTPTMLESNAGLLISGLVKTTLNETDSKLLNLLLDTLSQVSRHDKVQSCHCTDILKAFYVIAVSHGGVYNNRTTELAAECYLKGVEKIATGTEILSNLVDFTTSPLRKVRTRALEIVKDISFWKPHAVVIFLNDTILLESISATICEGPDCDQLLCLQICRQMAFDTKYHEIMVKSPCLLKALVRFLTTEPVKNRGAFEAGVDVLLTLFSKDLVVHFVPHSTLLPWMVDLANRTTSDDLKLQLIATILVLSDAMLAPP